jgi:hypothetical protein
VTGDRDIVAVLVDIDGTLIITGGARATEPSPPHSTDRDDHPPLKEEREPPNPSPSVTSLVLV